MAAYLTGETDAAALTKVVQLGQSDLCEFTAAAWKEEEPTGSMGFVESRS